MEVVWSVVLRVQSYYSQSLKKLRYKYIVSFREKVPTNGEFLTERWNNAFF